MILKSKQFYSLLAFLSIFPSILFAQEQVTITTYYPSPYGSYNELTVAGNVGIGTTGPIGKLQVGALPSGVGGAILGLYADARVNAAFYTGLGGVSIASNFDGYTEPYTTYGLVFTAMNSGSETTQFENWSIAPLNYDSTAHGLAFTGARTSNGTTTNIHTKTPFMLINTDGNVGIGTTGPNTKLEVMNNGGNGAGGLSDYGIVTTGSSGQITIGAEATGDLYSNLNLWANVSGTRKGWHISRRIGTNNLEIYKFDSSAGGFAGPYFAIANGGNVGIGTTGPGALLHTYLSAAGSSDREVAEFGANGGNPYITLGGAPGGYILFDDTNNITRVGVHGNTGMVVDTNGNVGIGNANPATFRVQVTGSVGPDNHDSYDLGSTGLRWRDVWCQRNAFNGSDARQKTNIIDTPLGLDFIMRLRPVQFNWIKEDDGKHQGLIAQDLEAVLKDKAIEFAGLRHDQQSDTYGLAYTEFIAPLIKAVQEQQSQIEKQQKEIESLKSQFIGSTTMLLEATNTIKELVRETKDLKAEIAGLVDKVVKIQ
jgi:hypothetical protein